MKKLRPVEEEPMDIPLLPDAELSKVLSDIEDDNTKNHYVNNKEFLEAIIQLRLDYNLYQKGKIKIKPRVSEYIGECLFKIATNLSHKSKFANYPYREDMIQDGVENSLRCIYNFDPEISKNPFSYFTQVVYYAFVRRIKIEKKDLVVKCQAVQNVRHDNLLNSRVTHKSESVYFDRKIDEFIEQYKTSMATKKKKKLEKKTNGLKKLLSKKERE